MKKSILSIALAFSGYASAQVGINTDTPKSTLEIKGSIQTNFKQISENYTLTDDDQIIQVVNPNLTTITLPTFNVNDIPAGRRYTIKNANVGADAKNITIATLNSETINFNDNEDNANNVPSITLLPGEALEVIRNTSQSGNTWSVIGYNVNDTFYSKDGALNETRTVTIENDGSLIYLSDNDTDPSSTDTTPNFLIGNNTETIFSVNNETGRVYIGDNSSVSSRNSSRSIPSITSPQKFTVFGDMRVTDLPDQGEVESVPVVIDNNGVLRKGSLEGNTTNLRVEGENGISALTENGIATVKLGGELSTPGKTTITASSTSQLEIAGDVANAFSVDGTTFSVDGANNRVGIGTDTPQKSLHVLGTGLQLGSPLFLGAGNPGTAGQVLVSSGPNNAPTWSDPSTGGGTVNLAAVGTNGVSVSTSDGTATVKLGGTLSELTTLNISEDNSNAKLEILGGKTNVFSVQSDSLTNLSVDNENNRVGIGTETPNATLDIQARYSSGYYPNVIDGLLIPRVGRDRANDMRNVQKSTLIYVDKLVGGGASAKVQYIDELGFYYFDGTYWVKLKGEDTNTTYNANNGLTLDGNTIQLGGDLTKDTSITGGNQNNYKLSIDNAVANGFSVGGNALSVDTSSKNVGIGTDAPTTKLDVRGSVKIVDGTEGAGKVLTSDDSGNASWQTITSSGTPSTPVNAGSGLTKNGDNIDLGGTLTRPATISSTTAGGFTITGNVANAFEVTSSTVSNLLVDNSTNHVGIGTRSPKNKLHIASGNLQLEGALHLGKQGASGTGSAGNPGSAGQLLVSDGANNSPIWKNASDVLGNGGGSSTPVNAGSGLTKNGDNIDLGGTLTSSANITSTLNYKLQVDGDVPNAFSVVGKNNTTNFSVNNNTNKVGIGTLDPQTELDVRGQVKIVDGTQGAGKVLTSDGSGNASWQTITSSGTPSTPVNAGSGLTKNGDDIDLGGTLTTSANINTSGINTVKILGNTTNSFIVAKGLSDTPAFSVNPQNGRIGIGTAVPRGTLEIKQSSSSFPTLSILDGYVQITDGTQGEGKVLTSDANGKASWQTITSSGAPSTSPIDANNGLTKNGDYIQLGGELTKNTSITSTSTNKLQVDGDVSNAFSVVGKNNTTNFSVNNNTNKVGIGTLDPQTELDVRGQVKITDGTQGAGKVLTSDANGKASWQTITSSGTPSAPVNAGSGLTKNGDDIDLGGTLTKSATITSTEDYRLKVRGIVQESFSVEGNNVTVLSVDGKNDRLGIGTKTPTSTLDVRGQVRIVDGTQGADKVLTSDANGNASWKTITSSGAPSTSSIDANNGLTKNGDYIQLGGELTQNTSITGGNNGANNYKLSIDNTVANGFSAGGNALSVDTYLKKVGIGTNAPQNKLHVAEGNLQIEGSLNVGTGSGNAGSAGQLLVSDGANKTPIWKNASDILGNGGGSNTSSITANSGLTKTGDNIQLGGSLEKPTTITTTTANKLSIEGPGTFSVTNGSNKNLFVNNANGRVGIGTDSPDTNLHIAGQVKITGGSPGADKVLTSDANGLASWGRIEVPIHYLNLYGTTDIPENNNGETIDTNIRIELEPGAWIVNFSVVMQQDPLDYYAIGDNFIRLRFKDVPNSSTTAEVAQPGSISPDAIYPKLASGAMALSQKKGVLTGSLGINNTSGAKKTYYLYADNATSNYKLKSWLKFGWNESYISYYPIDYSTSQ